MAIASTALRSVAQSGARPGQCLSEVNQFLAARDIPGMFVSLLYGIVDTATWRVVCANAGHPPPYRRCDGAGAVVEIVCEGGPVLGIMSDLDFGETEFDLAPGELMVLYTDGVTEAYDDTRQAFGADRLQALIADAEATAVATVAHIDDRIANFTRGAEQHDDVTALVVRRAS